MTLSTPHHPIPTASRLRRDGAPWGASPSGLRGTHKWVSSLGVTLVLGLGGLPRAAASTEHKGSTGLPTAEAPEAPSGSSSQQDTPRPRPHRTRVPKDPEERIELPAVTLKDYRSHPTTKSGPAPTWPGPTSPARRSGSRT